jgi:hypothetical protein
MVAFLVMTGVLADPPREVDLAEYGDAAIFEATALDDALGGGEVAVCDIDADGIEDLVIAASKGDGPGQLRPNGGDVYLVYGARRRWAGIRPVVSAASTRIVGQEALDSLGSGAVCADFNGDGYGDVLLEAFNADSVENGRDQAGQAHLIFGAPTLPALIDLAQPYDTVIYGAEPLDAVGDEPAAGDVNGDGITDILLDAAHATSRTGGKAQAGKVHILFGRAAWPPILDLRSQSDVTIHGATLNDNLGFELGSGDLDGDGTDEVLADAPGGDGPLDARPSCGDILVFRGRAVWPQVIDLAFTTTLPDTIVWGADAEDQFGRTSLTVGDLDADGTAELIAGGPFADGPSGTASQQGEVRTAAPGSAWPATLDLRSAQERVVYGADADDAFGIRLSLADIDGDGRADLVSTSSDADGPGNSRSRCGETYVILGSPTLSADIRLQNGEYDVIVYGAERDDRTGVARFASDINDDGLQEIILRGRTGVGYGKLARVYLVSPYDVDGDGLSQLADNCPLVANASQLDSDTDGRGDACATDWDGDGQVDGEDCAPNRAADGTPGEVTGLRVTGAGASQVEWDPQGFANMYDLTRGFVAQLSETDLGACQNARDPDRRDTAFVDDERPPAGAGFFYLVRGRNVRCGVAGTYGWTSAGVERTNQSPLACP